jgi:hypothetical protein
MKPPIKVASALALASMVDVYEDATSENAEDTPYSVPELVSCILPLLLDANMSVRNAAASSLGNIAAYVGEMQIKPCVGSMINGYLTCIPSFKVLHFFFISLLLTQLTPYRETPTAVS